MTDTKPTNVVAALSCVMAELPAIGKDQTSTQGYQYRGIEQITREVQPLFAKYGIVFAPQVERFEERELVVNGKPWTDQRLIVRYKVYGPGGIEDFIEVGVPGIGRDNSDKGANKAMSQAFKYALIQALCIADAKDDTDSEPAHEASSHRSAEHTPSAKPAGVVPAQAAPATSTSAPEGESALGKLANEAQENFAKHATAKATPRQQQDIKDLISKYVEIAGESLPEVKVKVRKLTGCSFTDLTAEGAADLISELEDWIDNSSAQEQLGGGVK